VQYIVEVTGTPTGDLETLLVSELGPGGEEAFVTGAEQLREEGRRAGQARLLIKLLDLRFGAVAYGYAGRVHAADEAQVDQWAERVLDAADIDEVFEAD
ncbi:MAG: transposase, partial [Myxococcales bacterium]|nr:transposase [Myxococcales bacterium]